MAMWRYQEWRREDCPLMISLTDLRFQVPSLATDSKTWAPRIYGLNLETQTTEDEGGLLLQSGHSFRARQNSCSGPQLHSHLGLNRLARLAWGLLTNEQSLLFAS